MLLHHVASSQENKNMVLGRKMFLPS